LQKLTFVLGFKIFGNASIFALLSALKDHLGKKLKLISLKKVHYKPLKSGLNFFKKLKTLKRSSILCADEVMVG